ncbi:hypothetical protein [Rhodoflexus caldus]|uniref:hypothetical protein n=1 Tax=Rhodoflexus caldus TaxID=2891236 RepID=UPI00202A6795|nr:hypothetical protein [Rhodoflexus caldus]
MKTFKLTVTLTVSEVWIEDGFDATTPEFAQSLAETIKENYLTYAYDHEFQVGVGVEERLDVRLREHQSRIKNN